MGQALGDKGMTTQPQSLSVSSTAASYIGARTCSPILDTVWESGCSEVLGLSLHHTWSVPPTWATLQTAEPCAPCTALCTGHGHRFVLTRKLGH
jgi:hypothetical protein